jgi:hypothetical protein
MRSLRVSSLAGSRIRAALVVVLAAAAHMEVSACMEDGSDPADVAWRRHASNRFFAVAPFLKTRLIRSLRVVASSGCSASRRSVFFSRVAASPCGSAAEPGVPALSRRAFSSH